MFRYYFAMVLFGGDGSDALKFAIIRSYCIVSCSFSSSVVVYEQIGKTK